MVGGASRASQARRKLSKSCGPRGRKYNPPCGLKASNRAGKKGGGKKTDEEGREGMGGAEVIRKGGS